MQRVEVDVIHVVMFNQDAIIAILERVTYHGSHLPLCAMVITFMVTSIRSLINVAVQVDWLHSEICHWHMDTNNLLSIQINNFNVLLNKNVFIHLVAVDGVPEVRQKLLIIVNTNYLKAFGGINLFPMLLYAKQYQPTYGIRKGRVRIPKFFGNLRLSLFAFQRYTLTFEQCFLYRFLVHFHTSFAKLINYFEMITRTILLIHS